MSLSDRTRGCARYNDICLDIMRNNAIGADHCAFAHGDAFQDARTPADPGIVSYRDDFGDVRLHADGFPASGAVVWAALNREREL